MLNSLLKDLQRWGPESDSAQPVSLEDARNYTAKVAKAHTENFPVVSWRLPKELRQPFYDIYAFCRWADDLADELGSRETSLRMLNWWNAELTACYAGKATHPVYIALKQTIAQFSLPSQPFHHLIDAFETDQSKTRYNSFEELLDYCSKSANPVGFILMHLFDCVTPENQRLSDALCTGLQLINFWQDVARDFEIDRIYLPLESMQQFGVTQQCLQEKKSSPQFIEMLKQEVNRAEQYLKTGLELGDYVPKSFRFDIRLFALAGLCLCNKIRKINFCVLEERPKLRKADFVKIAWQAWRN